MTEREHAGVSEFARRARAYAVQFAVGTAALLVVYQYPFAQEGFVATLMKFQYSAYAQASGAVVKLFDGQASVSGNVIFGRFSVSVNQGCDAMEVLVPLSVAILAFPANWRSRVLGALAGICLIVSVNVIRIASLYFAGARSTELFELLHVEVWPVVLVLCAALAFLFWLQRQDLGRATPGHGKS